MDLFGDLPPPSSSAVQEELPSRKRSDESCQDEGPITKKVKESSDVRYQLFGYHGERRGEREEMEDAYIIMNDMTISNDFRVSLYGVFDGHSGSRASLYGANNLHKIIAEKFPKGDVSPQLVKRCLVESFKRTDSDFLSLASKATPTWKDGSTATVVMAIDNVIYCSNLGDSKSVLYRCTDEIQSIVLTKDHTSSNFEERKRIEKTGGYVREGRVMGIVEVTRSIGDGRFKGCGLISTPHVLRCELTDKDMFIVIACDGLWNVFKIDEVAQFILTVIEDQSIEPPEEDNDQLVHCSKNVREYKLEIACDKLAVEAVKRGTTDNVTILIIDIHHKITN